MAAVGVDATDRKQVLGLREDQVRMPEPDKAQTVLGRRRLAREPRRVHYPSTSYGTDSADGRRGMQDSVEDRDSQAYLNRWERRWANTRIHGTTKRQAAATFCVRRPPGSAAASTPSGTASGLHAGRAGSGGAGRARRPVRGRRPAAGPVPRKARVVRRSPIRNEG